MYKRQDYHWPVPTDAQLAMFEAHIRLALELDKPIIVHDRNAHALSLIPILILAFTPVTSLIYRLIFGIAIVGDLLYLVAYESWNHSAD